MHTNNSDKEIYFIVALMEVYAQALSECEGTHWFTSHDLVEAIRNIDPATSVTESDVYQILHDAGFRYQPRPGSVGCEFRWMMKQK